MRTKLQRLCLLIGVLFIAYAFMFGLDIDYSQPIGIVILFWTIFVALRLGVVVLAGYVANDINRSEFLFIILTLLVPGPTLVVLGLMKPKKKKDEKQAV